ncbi:MAG: ribosome small subunit-dependent GTPase A [Phycisphaerae bacterium]
MNDWRCAVWIRATARSLAPILTEKKHEVIPTDAHTKKTPVIEPPETRHRFWDAFFSARWLWLGLTRELLCSHDVESMSSPSRKGRGKKERKVRVDLRRNRARPRRAHDWTRLAREALGHEFDSQHSESITAKGELSRKRTVIVGGEQDGTEGLVHCGTVVAMRGLYASVDDGGRLWTCTVCRLLRTRAIEERHPVTVGDRVRFRVAARADGVEKEGVIESVEKRRGQLRRRVGRRTQCIVANIDQAVIVSSAADPPPKAHLIDRYIVAGLAGQISPVICMNKVDLDVDGSGAAILERYARLGYASLCTSVVTKEHIDVLHDLLAGRVSVLVGQSGVGKSSLLNTMQPGLRLRTGEITRQVQKGRHTTSTAVMLRLDRGGYVVDTPGIRSFDVSVVARHEFEAYFAEFRDCLARCRFPDCTHIHEDDCAVKQAVADGGIHPERYESYVRLFEDRRR